MTSDSININSRAADKDTSPTSNPTSLIKAYDDRIARDDKIEPPIPAQNSDPLPPISIDDRFVNEDKLEMPLGQIFGTETGWTWHWRLGKYVIENPPFPLTRKHVEMLEAV